MLTALLRTLLMYPVILLSVRVMGKRQISQLQTSELVVTLLLSELAVLPVQELDRPLWEGLIPMGVLVACELTLSFLMLKRQEIHRLVCGKPVMVIERGRVIQRNLRRLRMSTEDLFEELRLDGVFHLEDVAYAIMETNGTLSVFRNTKDDPLTPRLAGVKVKPEYPELVVVSDGQLAPASLRLCGRDEAWALAQLRARDLTPEQVFLMTARPDGKVLVVEKERKKGAR